MRHSMMRTPVHPLQERETVSQKWMLPLWAAILAMVIILAPAGWGQDNATITGTVADTSGAVVPNAALTLTNPANGQKRDK